MVKIARLAAHVFRAPTPRPVETSFGVMRDRPAVFVRLEDSEGAFGWGEVFANWPAAGAEHRAHLLMQDLAPLVLGRAVAGPPQALWHDLTRQTHIRALQCGEWGPFRQVIAGLDLALHDLLARRAGQPMAAFLAPDPAFSVPVYASGLHVATALPAIAAARASGIAAFKVKVGFGLETDLAGLHAALADLRPGEQLLTDGNQAWGRAEALAFLQATRGMPLGWLEEPLPADAPPADWAAVAAASHAPLAGGENIVGEAAFEAAIASGHLRYLQPDLIKWGGFSGCLPVARAALAAGRVYCPHYLGGGIGLLASAHALAAVGGPGLLELDANENPLRDAFLPPAPVQGGRLALGTAPGLGITALPEALEPFRTLALETSAA